MFSADRARSKISPRRPASKRAHALSKNPATAKRSRTQLSAAIKPLRTKSRSRYNVSSRSKVITVAMEGVHVWFSVGLAEDSCVVAQHRDAFAPVVVGSRGEPDGFLQQPLRKACSRCMSERKATAKSGVDLENANPIIVGDCLETKRSARARKNLG